MKNIKWYFHRLNLMSLQEIIHRIHEFYCVTLMRIKFYIFNYSSVNKCNIANDFIFYSDTSLLPELNWQDINEDQIKFALSGGVNLFSKNWFWSDDEKVWLIDPITGNEWPSCFFNDIRYREGSDFGDIRFLWEPGRLQQLVLLSQIHSICDSVSDREKALFLLENQFYSFIENNYLYQGPHYISAMECALRIISICHTYSQAKGILHNKEKFWQYTSHLVETHADFISRRLSLYSSAGNHTIAECVGLLYAGILFPEFSKSRNWIDLALPILEVELDRQILKDGGGLEQSIWYHYFTSNLGSLADKLLTLNSLPSERISQAVSRAKFFFNSIASSYSNLPSIGDSDNGFAVSRYVDNIFESDYSSESKTALTNVFKDTGLSLFYSLDRSQRCIFKHGDFGMPPAYGHAHADALSICLSSSGRDLLVDTGTYAYNQNADLRFYFRSTRAQNTISINTLDQAEQLTSFIWKNTRKAELIWHGQLEEWSCSIAKFQWIGKVSATHYRACLSSGFGDWFFWDCIDGSDIEQIDLYWHVNAEVIRDSGQIYEGNLNLGKILISGASDIQFIKGSFQPLGGWCSDQYGEKRPITTIKASHSNAQYHEFTTMLKVGDGDLFELEKIDKLKVLLRKNI